MSSKITAGAPWTGKLKVLWNALFYFRELFSRPLERYVLRDHLQRRNAKGPGTLQCWQSVVIKEAQLQRWMSHINLNWENHTLGAAFGSAELHGEHALQRALLEREEPGIRKASVLGVTFSFSGLRVSRLPLRTDPCPAYYRVCSDLVPWSVCVRVLGRSPHHLG